VFLTAEPYIVAETAHYVVLYKPAFVHSVPLKRTAGQTLLSWCAERFPEVMAVHGKCRWEGGILHRLDYEAHGLILCARTQDAFNALYDQQSAGLFVKEYRVVSANKALALLPGFPQRPYFVQAPCTIESAFRSFGPGRQAVRPVLVSDTAELTPVYQTEVVQKTDYGDTLVFIVRLRRGFRHQVRCHLSWLGYPLLNDARYGGVDTGGALALCAQALSFYDPASKEQCRYRLAGVG
jgi:23S rRNA pseudouridine1911/1915/1917 synthase